MIRCPKCEAENQIGSIFCRSCGERLNLEEIKPDEIARHSRQSGLKTTAVVAGRIAKLALLVLVVLSLVALFIPPPQGIGDYEEAQTQYRSGRMKLNALQRGVSSGTEVTFTSAELNALADAMAGFATENIDENSDQEQVRKDILHSVDIHLWPRSGGYVKCVLKSEFMGRVPIYSSVTFQLKAGDEGLTSRVRSARVGRLPMPGPAAQLPLTRLKNLYGEVPDLFKDIAPRIEEVDSSADGFTLETAE